MTTITTRISQIQLVMIPSTDQDRSVAFYESLGFEIHRTDRAYALEIEPRYVDAAIDRWQAYTRKDAVCATTGLSFDEIAERRTEAGASNAKPLAG